MINAAVAGVLVGILSFVLLTLLAILFPPLTPFVLLLAVVFGLVAFLNRGGLNV